MAKSDSSKRNDSFQKWKIKFKEKKENFKFHYKEYKGRPLLWFTGWLYSSCGTKQWKAIIILLVLLSVFITLIAFKDFGDTPIVFYESSDSITKGALKPSFIAKLAAFFVDFATLPLILITILFSVFDNFKDSIEKHESNIRMDKLEKKMDYVKDSVTQKDAVNEKDSQESVTVNAEMNGSKDIKPDTPDNSDIIKNISTNRITDNVSDIRMDISSEKQE